MSALQHPDAVGVPDLQIWNNAAFDDGSDGGGSAVLKEPSAAWCPLRPIPAARAPGGLFHGAGKENRGVGLPGPSPVPKKTPTSKTFPFTPITVKQPTLARKTLGFAGDDARVADVVDIEEEIQQVEKEIGRLTLRLETLRLHKAERDSRTAERRGRIVPAKFLEPKTISDKNDRAGAPATRKVQESPASAKFGRRGASLGPLEISTSVGLQQPGMPGIAPARSAQGRRKSFIQKLQDVAEEEGEGDKKEKEKPLGFKEGTPDIRSKRTTDSPAAPTSVEFRRRGASLGPSEIAAVVGSCRLGKKLQEVKEEGAEPKKGSRRSLSSSPKSRQAAAKLPELRRGIATVESKKLARRENPMPNNLPPKTLFQEAKKPVKKEQTAPLKSLKRASLPQEVKKSAAVKRPGKSVKIRTVASRYSLITVRVGRNAQEGKRRKWSLPDSGKDAEEATDVKRSRMSMPVAGRTLALENQGRLQWGPIPDQIDEEADSIEASPPSIMRIAHSLPKIRTVRCDAESPRDSGRAKRVAELVGRESHFSAVVEDEGTTSASCESMDLGEDEQ